MRTLKSIMVLGLALSTFTATEAAKLTFKVTNPNEKVKVRLTFSQSGEQKEVAIDAAGNGNIEITGFTPQYVTMQYTRGRRTLYLDPNQDLTLSFDSDNMWRNTTFEGAGAAINTYLGSKELQSLGMPDMKMQEAALIHKGDSLYAANCQVLEAAKLPKRTYFFDVKATRNNDYYLTITESKKKFDKDGVSSYEKHKIFLYKEDFEKFAEGLEDAVAVVKSALEGKLPETN